MKPGSVVVMIELVVLFLTITETLTCSPYIYFGLFVLISTEILF